MGQGKALASLPNGATSPTISSKGRSATPP